MVIYAELRKISSGSSTLTSGLIGYWSLDDSSGQATDSLGNYNLTNSGVNFTTGLLGNCGSFISGTASYLSNLSFSFAPSAYTISAWVKHPSRAVDNNERIISTQNEASGGAANGIVFAYNSSTNLLRTYHQNNGWSPSSTVGIEDGNWHHVISQWTGTKMIYYVDNAFAGSGDYSQTFTNVNFFRIGINSAVSDSSKYYGNMDEIGIWSRALDTTEINTLYGSGNGLAYSGFTSAETETTYNDAENINLTLTNSDNNSSSYFSAIFPNQNGLHKDDFSINDDVSIYVDKDINPPTTKRFRGIIGDISMQDRGVVKNMLTVTGRDYTGVLQNVTVEPSIYNDLDAGSIVKSIMSEFVPSITTGSVDDTGVIIKHIAFNHVPVYDAINQLATQTGFYFFVDTEKNLNFKKRGTISSSVTLGSDNITRANFRDDDKEIYNQVWVYGDRELTSAPLKSVTSDGVGSVIQLDYKPSNTEVTKSGTDIVKGGIFEMNTIPQSGIFYLVDYDQAKIIWTSGTDIGYNVPGSLVVSTVKYDRTLPIVKFGEEDVSVNTYGARAKIIQDKSIKNPKQARDLVISTLAEYAYPSKEGTLTLQGINPIDPGNSVVVNLPNYGVTNKTYNIFSINYDLNKNSCLKEEVMTVRINEKIPDMTDTIKQMILDIKKLQAGDIDPTDILTRIKSATGSAGLIVDTWTASTWPVGSNFYIGSFATSDKKETRYYKLNGNFTDSSINNQTATLNGTVTVTGGVIGSGYAFAGSPNSLMIPNINLSGTSFSVMAWLKRSANGVEEYGIGGGDSAANYKNLHFGYKSTNGFIMGFWGDDLNSTSTYATSGTWEHWAGTFDRRTKERKLYRNGSLENSDTASGLFAGNTTGSLYIGQRLLSAWWIGAIDDVRIYDHVISQADVKSIYNDNNGSELVLPWVGFCNAWVGSPGSFYASSGTKSYTIQVSGGES